MASTQYIRPNLFPFSYASIPDYSGDASYAKFGTSADVLNCLTNLLKFQVSVSWSFSWKYPLNPTVYDNSYSVNINLPLFIPPTPGSDNFTVVSWYNSDTIGTKRVNPAARVLYAGSGGDSIVSAFSIDEPNNNFYDQDAILRLSRVGTVTQLALQLRALNVGSPGAMGDPFRAGFNSVPSDNLATILVDVMGTLIPYYLKTGGPPASDFVILTPIAFSATVTPTFSAT